MFRSLATLEDYVKTRAHVTGAPPIVLLLLILSDLRGGGSRLNCTQINNRLTLLALGRNLAQTKAIRERLECGDRRYVLRHVEVSIKHRVTA